MPYHCTFVAFEVCQIAEKNWIRYYSYESKLNSIKKFKVMTFWFNKNL